MEYCCCCDFCRDSVSSASSRSLSLKYLSTKTRPTGKPKTASTLTMAMTPPTISGVKFIANHNVPEELGFRVPSAATSRGRRLLGGPACVATIFRARQRRKEARAFLRVRGESEGCLRGDQVE